MANFIKIKSNDSGDHLINTDDVCFVHQPNDLTTVIVTDQYLIGAPSNPRNYTLTHTSTGTTPSMRDAINTALTANPGGVEVLVIAPAGIDIEDVSLPD